MCQLPKCHRTLLLAYVAVRFFLSQETMCAILKSSKMFMLLRCNRIRKPTSFRATPSIDTVHTCACLRLPSKFDLLPRSRLLTDLRAHASNAIVRRRKPCPSEDATNSTTCRCIPTEYAPQTLLCFEILVMQAKLGKEEGGNQLVALRGGLGRRGVLKPRHRKTPKAPLEAAAAVLIDFKWRPRMERRGSFFT